MRRASRVLCVLVSFVSVVLPRAGAARRSTKASASARRAWAAPSSPSPTMRRRPGGTRRAWPAARYFSAVIEYDRADGARRATRACAAFAVGCSRPRPQLLPLALSEMRPSDLYRTAGRRRPRRCRACLSRCSARRSGSRSAATWSSASTREAGARAGRDPMAGLDIGGDGDVRTARGVGTDGAGTSRTPEFGGRDRRDVRAAGGRRGRARRSPPGRAAPSGEVTVAVDADLTTTPTALGDERQLAAGARGCGCCESSGWASAAASAANTHRRTPAVGQRAGRAWRCVRGMYRRRRS